MLHRVPVLLLLVMLLASCGDTAAPPAPSTTSASPTTSLAPPTTSGVPSDECAHVIAATVDRAGDGTYTFSATVASADTGNEKYADLWEVRDQTGTVLAVRVLAHPHVGEQPFTRSLSGVEVPAGSGDLSIWARDSVVGFCGDGFEVGAVE